MKTCIGCGEQLPQRSQQLECGYCLQGWSTTSGDDRPANWPGPDVYSDSELEEMYASYTANAGPGWLWTLALGLGLVSVFVSVI